MSARDKRVDKAQLKVLFQVPFFAPGVARLPVGWDDQIPTACTNGESIRFNPAFFDKLTDQELVTVLCHEVCHAMLGHLWRTPPGADMGVWNQACDHAVNNMLKSFSEQVTSKGLADPFPFPAGSWCMDPAFKEMAEETIYNRLPKPPLGGGGKGKGKGPGGGGGRQPFGEFENGKAAGQDQAKQKGLQSDWGDVLRQSADIQKKRGTVPAEMERLIKEMTETQIPWFEILRNWLREQASDDFNWMKPNRLYGDSELIMPVMESEKIGPIVFATDTSGSIDEEMLSHFQSEKQSCLDELRPSRLVDIQCDAKIQKVGEYRIGEVIPRECKGGGGTDFKPVFEHVAKKLGESPKCLVYLTDLYGDFPEKAPEYPVLWVTWTEGAQAPFGLTVYAKDSR